MALHWPRWRSRCVDVMSVSSILLSLTHLCRKPGRPEKCDVLKLLVPILFFLYIFCIYCLFHCTLHIMLNSGHSHTPGQFNTSILRNKMKQDRDQTRTRQEGTRPGQDKTHKTSTVQGLQIQTEVLIAVVYREVTGKVLITLTYDQVPILDSDWLGASRDQGKNPDNSLLQSQSGVRVVSSITPPPATIVSTAGWTELLVIVAGTTFISWVTYRPHCAAFNYCHFKMFMLPYL